MYVCIMYIYLIKQPPSHHATLTADVQRFAFLTFANSIVYFTFHDGIMELSANIVNHLKKNKSERKIFI